MWIIAGYVTVDPSERATYVEAFRDLIKRARQAPGCLDVAITPDPAEPDRVYNYERWESWDAIEAWRQVADAPDPGVKISDVHVMAYEVAAERPPF